MTYPRVKEEQASPQPETICCQQRQNDRPEDGICENIGAMAHFTRGEGRLSNAIVGLLERHMIEQHLHIKATAVRFDGVFRIYYTLDSNK